MGQPLLTVVVPVYNQAQSIVANLDTIEERIREGLGEPFELIVVSDGSADRTEELLLGRRSELVRVLHYDRNLGKGYALKLGGLQARGRWVGYVDADLDLDPAAIPRFLRHAERHSLDFVIGSKRHPESMVEYPRSRRVASWLYQQLVRLLFRLDVRDTQVGLKVFRREVADEVLPLLIVKRYAFDLELLAVARSLGFTRIEEAPIRLDYRFAGSGVRSLAVLRALVDTAAIFYRLRVLRYYQRKRALAGAFGWTRPRGYAPLVSIVTSDPDAVRGLDYPELEILTVADASAASAHKVALQAGGPVLAFLEEGGRPAGNWISATTPFLRRTEVGAVVVPKMAPHEGSARSRAAAAVGESRLGSGSLYFRYTPGNIRYVTDFPGGSVVVTKERYLALDGPVPLEELAAKLTAHGDLVLYTPETVVVGAPPPLFGPHLASTFSYGLRRGREVRRRGVRALRPSTLLPVALLVFLVLGLPALVRGGAVAAVWLAGALAYAVAVTTSSAIAAFVFRDLAVSGLAAAGLVSTHLVYAAGFLRGLARR